MAASVPPSATDRLALVARLRAAGCVFAEDEADLLISSAESVDDLLSMVDRRVDGLPLEHVLGWAEFCGLRITVPPGVFVPRPRTELLVRVAADLAAPAATVVDLCCGSGAVGAAVAAAMPGIRLHAADIDPVSVASARLNLASSAEGVYEGDLFTALPERLHGRVDILVANVPYVPTGEISLLPAEARLHEPRLALDGGVDGLDVLRRVATEAPRWLAPGGHLLVETSVQQVSTAVGVMDRVGLTTRVIRDEDLDATVVVGSRIADHEATSAAHVDFGAPGSS